MKPDSASGRRRGWVTGDLVGHLSFVLFRYCAEQEKPDTTGYVAHECVSVVQ